MLTREEIARRIAALPHEERVRALVLADKVFGLATEEGEVGNLRTFATRNFPSFKWHKHTEMMGEHLEACAKRQIRRLMVKMPPRHGKTLLCSKLFPAWYLRKQPAEWVGAMSYGAKLVKVMSRDARTAYIRSGGKLRPGSAEVFRWETMKGGGMWASGMIGPKTGSGFHIGLVDDPLRGWKDAQSATVRESIQSTYEFDFETRAMGEEVIILVMTRWHEADLAGWLLDRELEEPEHWHIVHMEALKTSVAVSYPATCTVAPDPREEGQPLCPEIRTFEQLWKTRGRNRDLFDALYQQQPRPRAGLLFKRHKFRVLPAAPAGLVWVRSWDLAATEGGGDYTVGSKTGMDEAGRTYIDLRPESGMVRGQWESGGRNQIMRAVAEQDGKEVQIVGEIEGGSAGKDQARAITLNLRGFHVTLSHPTGDKVVRAEPLKSQVEVGNVFLIVSTTPEGRKLLRDFLEEFGAFPRGGNDDQVDAHAAGFNWLAEHSAYHQETLRLVVGR